jgi:hypothetical protein
MDLFDRIQRISTIDFLADVYDPYDNRRSYRTHQMAYAFIKLSLKYPLKNIPIHDHYLMYNGNIIIKNKLEQILSGQILTVYECFIIETKNNYSFIKYIPSDYEDSNTQVIWDKFIEKYEEFYDKKLKE